VGETLESLSGELAAVVESAAPAVVRVEGRRRTPSSGVVWSADGAIVTSHHAVDTDEEVPVGLADGRTVRARVVARDPGSDLALLRLEATGLVPPRWGDTAAARPGVLVLGLSRPGRSLRARLGVLSAVSSEWRTPSGARLERYLESDLALHSGFSGGLLVGADGAALGVNTAGLMRGAPLAVPTESVRRVVDALLAHGRMRRGYIGIGTQTIVLTPDLRSHAGQGAALIVLSIQTDSPAARAGLLVGDVLLRAGEERLTHPAALLPALDEEHVGRELALSLLRAGEERSVTVVIGERA
jgi:S1-C subfamily serine protease